MGKDVWNIYCVSKTFDAEGNIIGIKFKGDREGDEVYSFWALDKGQWKGKALDIKHDWLEFIQPATNAELFGTTEQLPEDRQFIMGSLVDKKYGNFQHILSFPGELQGRPRKHSLGVGATEIKCVAKTYDEKGSITALEFTGKDAEGASVSVVWHKDKNGEWVSEQAHDDWEQEVAELAESIHDPGALLDVLLVLYGEKKKLKEIKDLTRRTFNELNLGEITAGGGGDRSERDSISLIELFFKKASLVNQKDARDRETLINVFIRVAFKALMKPQTRGPILEQLQIRSSSGLFFEELHQKVKVLVEESMVFKASHIKRDLWPHQAVAAHFLKEHERAYLGDFTGAGKSLEVLSAMDPSWKVFISTPASLVDNWIKEIRKHFTHQTLVNTRIVPVRGSVQQKRALLTAYKNEKNVIFIGSIHSQAGLTSEDVENINDGLDLLIVDEVQYIVNFKGEGMKTNALRAEAIQLVDAKRKWFMSATGYGSDPKELFAVLRALYKGTEKEIEYNNYASFTRTRPTSEAVGLRYLRGDMRNISLIRQANEVMDNYRDPKEISFNRQHRDGVKLPNLHEVNYQELGGYTLNDEQLEILMMLIKDFQKFARWYNKQVPVEDQIDENNLNPFTKLYYIFLTLLDPQRVGGKSESPYWTEMDKVVSKYMSEGRKGVIYTNNIFVLENIMRRYKQYGIARIDGFQHGVARDSDGKVLKGYFDENTGEVVFDDNDPQSRSIDIRTYEKHRFQNDPNTHLIVVNSRAGGVGLDLTAADFYLLAQLPDTYTLERQVDGRQIRPDLYRPRYMVDKLRMIPRYPSAEVLTNKFKGTEYEEEASQLVLRSIKKSDISRVLGRDEKKISAIWAELRNRGYIKASGAINEETFQKAAQDKTQFRIKSIEQAQEREAIFRVLEEAVSAGTASEIQMERLNRQRRVFDFVMSDLASDEDVDLFDAQSLASLIPGFMEDPTMEEFFGTLKDDDLKRTLAYFFPLYEKAKTIRKKIEILALAESFYETGQLSGLKSLIEIVDHQDDRILTLMSSLNRISNKYVRKEWLERLMVLFSDELPKNGVASNDVLENIPEALMGVDADYLLLPVYEVSKGYQNGVTTQIIYDLVGEILESYDKKEQQKRNTLLKIAQSLLSVHNPFGRKDVREDFRWIMEEYGGIFNDRSIPLEERIRVFNNLLNLIPLPNIKEIISRCIKGNIASFQNALEEAIIVRRSFVFPSLSEEQMKRLFGRFRLEEVIVALQIRIKLMDAKYTRQAQEFDEIIHHVADDDFEFWRNQQRGARLFGDFVEYMKDNKTLWEIFTKEETVAVGRVELSVERNKDDVERLAGQIKKIFYEDNDLIRNVDGVWVLDEFIKWKNEPSSKRNQLGLARQNLEKIRNQLGKNRLLDAEQAEILKNEKIEGAKQEDLLANVERRIEQYANLQDWLIVNDRLNNISLGLFGKQDVGRLKAVIPRVRGRLVRAQETGLAEQLDQLLEGVRFMFETAQFDQLTVEFTSRPELIMQRGMLRPELINCFNSFGDPRQVSTLTDDLGSRNKMMVILKNKDSIMATAMIKIKQLEDGTPILFLEQPLNLRGHNFEVEILDAVKRSKFRDMKKFGVRLGYEGQSGDKRVKIFETGGYSNQEYIEPLFGVRTRGSQNLIYHLGVILPDEHVMEVAEDANEVKEKPMFKFVGGLGYEKRRIDDFIGMLKAQNVEVLVDVRANAFSRRAEYSSGRLASALKANGIKYVHLKDLGAPVMMRDGHRLGENDPEFMAAYENHFIASAKAREAYQSIGRDFKGRSICLMCYEANTTQCHRNVILKHLARDTEIKRPIIDLSEPLNPLQFDKAMGVESPGGIDLNVREAIEIKDNNQAIQFQISPSIFRQLEESPGFIPRIINIRSMVVLKDFLGLK